ncbi:MAG: methylenetetrahydrofolate reductase [Candidatus Omnitrophota bacterium]
MKFREKIAQGKFVVTSEIGPVKGTLVEEHLHDAELLRNKVDGINVTDLQSSVMRFGSLAMCRLLKEKGHEPILQLTCRDRNRLALQSDLLSAWGLGIENVLLLTGDHPKLGDHPQARSVFDVDSVQLLGIASALNNGKDMNGNALAGKPDFFLGAVVNPGADPLEPEVIKLEKKFQAGARFIQTQAVYDVKLFENFMNKVKHTNIPVMAGIVLLKSAGMAKYMNKNVSGVHVPDDLIKEMEQSQDKRAKSVEIASRLIKELKPMCSGTHIMPIGWDKLVPSVIDAAGLQR